ncbi:MAG: hypothetical protein RSB91_05445, partial [Clostridia bacterium]
LQSTKDKISDLTATKDDLDGFMKNVFNPGIDNGYEEFKNNLIDIYGKITETTGIENPWGNYFTQLADGSLQLKDGAQWVDAYTEANALLSLALSNTTEELGVQNSVLAEHEEQNAEFVSQKEEARAKAVELNQTIAEETQKYNELATAAGMAGDAAAGAGGAASQAGQQIELAGEGIANGASNAQAGADGFNDAADTLVDAQGKAEGATEGLETASNELATTKDAILATATDLKGAQDAATAAQTTIAGVVKTISTDAATALTTMDTTAASIVLTAKGMMEAIKTAVTDSIDAIATAGSDVATALVEAMSDILTTTAGDDLANTFLSALKSGITIRKIGLTQEASGVGKAVLSAFSDYLNYGSGSSIGANVVDGMAAGIRAGRSSVISAAIAVARAAITAAKNTLGIRSPSAVFREAIGAQVGAGMGLGILDSEGKVISSVEKLAGDMQNAVLGARMQDAVIQQGSSIGAMAIASGAQLLVGIPTGDEGDRNQPIDYVLLARAIWQEAPPSWVVEDVNGEYIAALTEPTVSAIQSRKLKNRKKG